MTTLSLSKAAVRRQASVQVFNQGESYYRGDAGGLSGATRQRAARAEVEGSQHESCCMRVT